MIKIVLDSVKNAIMWNEVITLPTALRAVVAVGPGFVSEFLGSYWNSIEFPFRESTINTNIFGKRFLEFDLAQKRLPIQM